MTKYLIIVILILVIGCGWEYHRADLKAAEAVKLTQDKTALQKQIDRLQQADSAKADTLDDLFTFEEGTANEKGKLSTAIQTAPKVDDAPLAPVFRNALDGLRRAASSRTAPAGHS